MTDTIFNQEILEQLAEEYTELETSGYSALENVEYILKDLVTWHGRDSDEAIEYFKENYIGLFNNWRKFADDHANERLLSVQHPEVGDDWAQSYFNYERYADDLSYDFICTKLPEYQGVVVLYDS